MKKSTELIDPYDEEKEDLDSNDPEQPWHLLPKSKPKRRKKAVKL